jgi:hypothetical protein
MRTQPPFASEMEEPPPGYSLRWRGKRSETSGHAAIRAAAEPASAGSAPGSRLLSGAEA